MYFKVFNTVVLLLTKTNKLKNLFPCHLIRSNVI